VSGCVCMYFSISANTPFTSKNGFVLFTNIAIGEKWQALAARLLGVAAGRRRRLPLGGSTRCVFLRRGATGPLDLTALLSWASVPETL
jgi:hypothetical protein